MYFITFLFNMFNRYVYKLYSLWNSHFKLNQSEKEEKFILYLVEACMDSNE